MSLVFADLDKTFEIEVTEYPEPVNGYLYEAKLKYYGYLTTKGAPTSDYLGLFHSVDEARDYARDLVKSEIETRRKGKEAAEIAKRYVSKTTYRIHN